MSRYTFWNEEIRVSCQIRQGFFCKCCGFLHAKSPSTPILETNFLFHAFPVPQTYPQNPPYNPPFDIKIATFLWYYSVIQKMGSQWTRQAVCQKMWQIATNQTSVVGQIPEIIVLTFDPRFISRLGQQKTKRGKV